MRKENHVTDVFLSEQHHAQAIDPESHPSRGRHAVLKSHEKIFVELLLFTPSLLFEAIALLDGIILLGVGRGDLLTIDAALEHFDC